MKNRAFSLRNIRRKEHKTQFCTPLSPVFTRDCGGRLNFIDEPTSGLDPVARDEITDIFLDFARDETHSVLISSHIVSDLEKMCDYVAFMHRGRIILCEEKDSLRDDYALADLNGINIDADISKKIIAGRNSPYGGGALIKRDFLPAGAKARPVNIEELFVYMIRGNNR